MNLPLIKFILLFHSVEVLITEEEKMKGEGGKNSVEGNQEPLGVIQIAPLYLLFFWES